MPVGGIGVVLQQQTGFISDIKQSHISGSENRTARFSTFALDVGARVSRVLRGSTLPAGVKSRNEWLMEVWLSQLH